MFWRYFPLDKNIFSAFFIFCNNCFLIWSFGVDCKLGRDSRRIYGEWCWWSCCISLPNGFRSHVVPSEIISSDPFTEGDCSFLFECACIARTCPYICMNVQINTHCSIKLYLYVIHPSTSIIHVRTVLALSQPYIHIHMQTCILIVCFW